MEQGTQDQDRRPVGQDRHGRHPHGQQVVLPDEQADTHRQKVDRPARRGETPQDAAVLRPGGGLVRGKEHLDQQREAPQAETGGQGQPGKLAEDARDEAGHDADGGDEHPRGQQALRTAHVAERGLPQRHHLQGEEKQEQPVQPVLVIGEGSGSHGEEQHPGDAHRHPGEEQDDHFQIQVRILEHSAFPLRRRIPCKSLSNYIPSRVRKGPESMQNNQVES